MTLQNPESLLRRAAELYRRREQIEAQLIVAEANVAILHKTWARVVDEALDTENQILGLPGGSPAEIGASAIIAWLDQVKGIVVPDARDEVPAPGFFRGVLATVSPALDGSLAVAAEAAVAANDPRAAFATL